MDEDKDSYYVVKKGDVVGFYKSLKDYEAQSGCSINDCNATIYKGYHLSKEAEQYLASNGLQRATYSISAANVTNDLFGKLLACPHEQPSTSKGKMAEEHSAKRPHQALETTEYEYVGANWWLTDSPEQQYHLDHGFETLPTSSSCQPFDSRGKMSECSKAKRQQQVPETTKCNSYLLEFDGASKGNPGLAGAGAILRAEDGSMVCRLQEGVGIATNNVAEYRAVILGLKHALKHGIKCICVKGDSKLVCMQVKGLWKIKNQNMARLCKVAKELTDKFVLFDITHIPREHNSDADALANHAIHLRDGVVVEDCS